MALSFTQLSATLGSTSNTNSYPGNAGTPAVGDVLVCFVSASDTVAAGTMTGGGLTWTKLFSATKNSGLDTLYIFWTIATGATSITPTFDCTGDNATGAIVHCIRATGGEGLSMRQVKSNAASTANPSVTMNTAILTGNGCLGFVANGTNSAVQFTQPGSWAEVGETSYNTPTNGAETASRNSGETGTTITWTCASVTPWVAVVLELWVNRRRSIGSGSAMGGVMTF